MVTIRFLFSSYTHREIFLQKHFFDWFGTKRSSVWRQINRKSVITIQIWFYLTGMKKYICVSIYIYIVSLRIQKIVCDIRQSFHDANAANLQYKVTISENHSMVSIPTWFGLYFHYSLLVNASLFIISEQSEWSSYY